MLTEIFSNRNGTIKSIKDIAHNLSSAKLGTLLQLQRTPIGFLSLQNLLFPHLQSKNTDLTPNDLDPDTEVVIAPPALYLLLAREHLSSSIEVAAQNCFDRPNGAFTGEISVEQLKDSGITWTLLGHSERRTILREEDEFIAKKTLTAVNGGVGVILCCGESLEEREKGTTVEVVTKQLEAVNKAIEKDHWKQIVIAYEPIWAIGTGKVATTGMYAVPRLPVFDCIPSHKLFNGSACIKLTMYLHRTSTRSPCSY